VLLIEAGGEDRGRLGGAFFKLPLAALGFQATPHHWGYECEEEKELLLQGKHWGEADGQHGRPLIQTRGKVLGGSSSINLCNYIRGHKDDYDEWASRGLEGWSFREVLGYFRRAEKLRVPDEAPGEAPPSQAEAPPTYRAAYLSISAIRAPHALSRAFVAACSRILGTAAASAPMLNSPHEGAGMHCVTVDRGIRCSNAAALRTPAAQAALRAGRLRVLTHCQALKLFLEKTAPRPRAAGVFTRCADGSARLFLARREVVLCAGAINTPHLLMSSGIGPEEELTAVEVGVLVDAPGVGRHLRDVAAVGVCASTRFATLDKQLMRPWPYLRYLLFRSGPLASNTLEASAFVSTGRLHGPASAAPSPPTRPAMQLLVQPLLFPLASWGKFAHFVSCFRRGTLPSACTVHLALLHPKSTGHISLRSRNPLDPPLIHPNYFVDPDDLKAVVAGVRLVRRILNEADELQVNEIFMPSNDMQSDAALEKYVRANACHFNGSLCGSCRMGPDSDPLSPLDAQLRVRGVDGLRVADSSAMPTLVCGQLNAAVTMIAEKAADMILRAHALEATGDIVNANSVATHKKAA